MIIVISLDKGFGVDVALGGEVLDVAEIAVLRRFEFGQSQIVGLEGAQGEVV